LRRAATDAGFGTRRFGALGFGAGGGALSVIFGARVSFSGLRESLPGPLAPDFTAGLAGVGFFDAGRRATVFFFAAAALTGFLAARFAGFPAGDLAFDDFAFIGNLSVVRARFALAKAPHYTVLPQERQGSSGASIHGNSRAVRAILRRL